MADSANPGLSAGDSGEGSADGPAEGSGDGETRRDFLYLAAGAMGAVGTAFAVWPLIDSMNPAADVLALSSTEVDLSPIEVGMAITVIWRGNPVFIRHRSAAEIEVAVAVPLDDLPDPQTDAERVQKPEWLVMVGVCTHLGCIPTGQRAGAPKGEYGGWFCPCHGSHYDTSGRIRKGPAPTNLPVPSYEFLDDTTIRIG
ncbi:MAG: ubiquinol-cytochrome c reductase iron-sulfur subunit [Proteobacteria bacterium]|nr:ubiquinol-cytochrome c reductase iron-sulfur subunit [Pseudomonadota bacterium]